MTIAFFDLDRTLLDVNSGTLWLREEWRRGAIGFVTAARAATWLTRYALGDVDLDRALDHAASVYAGVPVDLMTARVSAWFESDVRHRLRPGAQRALDAHRAAGDAVVLATTSSQFIAASARRAFDMDDAVATTLGVIDGRLDGTIADSAYGAHKLRQCERWAAEHGTPLAECVFYTDSASDLPLLERVGRPIVVHPDRRLRKIAHQRGWTIEDWGKAPR